jgi:hypothetical protein
MTDFLDENDNTLMPQDNDTEEPMSMTLGGIGRGDPLPEGGYEMGTASGGGGLLSHTPLLIGAVAVIAVGSLFLMRATQGELKSSDEVLEIEAKIANALNKLNSPSLLPASDPLLAENLNTLLTPAAEITAIFEHDVRDQQVPIEQVKKNPFSLGLVNDTADTTGQDNRKIERNLAKLRDEAKSLDLQSIMVGARNIAVVGGEFYKRGDRLGSFTITEIDKFTVYLESNGRPYELSLKDQN